MIGPDPSEHIARTADEWVVRSGGSLTADEVAERDHWRAADPRHERAWLEAQALWRATEGMPRPHVAPPRAVRRHFPLPVLALAGLAAIVAAAGGALLLKRQWVPPEIASITEWSAGGSVRHIRLGDGTLVDLDPGSRLHTDFTGPIRAVQLIAGTGRFDVAHDARHPFVVSARDRRVTAIGTRFEVALKPHGMVVTLFQGAVEVRAASHTSSGPVRMVHGQRLTVDDDHQSLTAIPADQMDAATTERDVDPTPVAQIIDEANRGTSLPIRVTDPRLAAQRVEGRFDMKDSAALAAQLGAALDLQVTRRDGALWLSRDTPS